MTMECYSGVVTSKAPFKGPFKVSHEIAMTQCSNWNDFDSSLYETQIYEMQALMIVTFSS